MQTGGVDQGESEQQIQQSVSFHNPILDAIIAANALGVSTPPGAPAGIPLVSDVHITNRTVDKFAMGWLGGVGSDSQFQHVFSRLPILPPSSNRDLEARISESRGVPGQRDRLLTRYEMPYNFNPGWGTDTWRAGQNVTWTLGNRGMTDPTTGNMGAVVYTARASDKRDQMAPFQSNRQGLAAMTAAPRILVTSITGMQAGMSLEEMQRAANMQYTQARVAQKNRAIRKAGGKGKAGRR